MQTTKKSINEVALNDERIIQPVSRRRFLGYVGATSALLATAASCSKDDAIDPGVDLGSGDVGILNYAYALEQLEAAFYVQVISSPFSGMTALETEYLTDIRNHEVAHREFFKAAITAAASSSLLQNLEVDFSSINFANRDSVLTTARTFEDLGVSAYNGAGQLISTTGNGPTYLTEAGKIVSVEARHAALIRDLIANGSFADPVDTTTGLDVVRTPTEVLEMAKTYIKTKLNASNLPS